MFSIVSKFKFSMNLAISGNILNEIDLQTSGYPDQEWPAVFRQISIDQY